MSDEEVSAERATEAVTFDVAPGNEAAFESWAHEITSAATRHPGHLGASWLRPQHSGDPYQVVIAFRSEKLLEEWMTSEERREWVRKLDGIASEHHARQTGLETWFDVARHGPIPPPKWKMTIVTIGAVYPLSVLFNWLVSPHVHSFNLFIRGFLFPLALVPILTYLVMPRLSKILRRFLYGRA